MIELKISAKSFEIDEKLGNSPSEKLVTITTYDTSDLSNVFDSMLADSEPINILSEYDSNVLYGFLESHREEDLLNKFEEWVKCLDDDTLKELRTSWLNSNSPYKS